jgi:hypothetical protein
MGHGIAGEGLQAGAVGAEAEFAIAQGQAPADLIPGDVMSRHQRVTVNIEFGVGSRRIACVQRGQRNEQ